jgi:hypothetical protein
LHHAPILKEARQGWKHCRRAAEGSSVRPFRKAKAWKSYRFCDRIIFYHIPKYRQVMGQPRVKGWKSGLLMGRAAQNLHSHLMYHTGAPFGYCVSQLFITMTKYWR